MFFRYIVALCLVALCVVAIHAETADPDNSVEVAAKVLSGLFAGVAESCLWEAAEECHTYLQHPGQVLSCGSNYLENNQERCALSE